MIDQSTGSEPSRLITFLPLLPHGTLAALNGTMVVVPAGTTETPYTGVYMRAGAASLIKGLCPSLEYQYGKFVEDLPRDQRRFGFVELNIPTCDVRIGILQVMEEWGETIDLELMVMGLQKLRQFAEANPALKIRVALPGNGCGVLTAGYVVRILSEIHFPPNVVFHVRKKDQQNSPLEVIHAG